ncbi:hypothetical protein [Rhodoferax sp. BAB1]|uniref:hypothetical protein n=1 Tax=Rhodoferax sp. BAB1 TaxID=2741720 RepID=UPI00157689B2|nr:hypothetical protein [Rhodoferax sp. BAB1]QKO23703.1 hypothetical protein HTY51_18300 [Rhodoferax sp. BAB1]
MSTFDEAAAVRTYLKLMHEVVTRLDLISYACNGQLNLAPPYAFEYCYLQYRRICELLALGCLQLHGDLPATRTNAATKEWNAERIMGLLHRSHPHAFPQCAVATKTPTGWNYVANSKPNAMTLVEFKALYGKCGQVLHRGTIRSVETEQPLQKQDYAQVILWSQKIVDLLNQHFVSRSDGHGLYFVSLKTESGGPACNVLTGFTEGAVSVATYNLSVETAA